MSASLTRIGRSALLWALTPGWLRVTPADRIRGWARFLDWYESGWRQWPGLAVHAALNPLRALKDAYVAARMHGAAVRSVSGLSPINQTWQLWMLAVRHGLVPGSYRTYQLYRPERYRRAGCYMQQVEHYRVTRWMYRSVSGHDAATLKHKERFERWCDARNVPTVPTIAEFHDGRVTDQRSQPEISASLPSADLFVKPADGTGGQGAQRWLCRHGGPAGESWTGPDGKALNASELVEYLLARSKQPTSDGSRPRLLLQPCVRNHPAIAAILPDALCTLRVVTFDDGANSRVLLAAHKFARAGRAGDNTDLGGISAPADLQSGILSAAVGPDGALRRSFPVHPDTGAPIAGVVVPHFHEALALCVSAHQQLRSVLSVGWDIAITESGPIVLEANSCSNTGIAQAPTGVPLADTPYPGLLDTRLREVAGLAVPARVERQGITPRPI